MGAKRLEYQNNFDLLRLFAALQVICGHGVFHLRVQQTEETHVLSWFVSAFPGVPVFFMISGFLVSQSWERSPSVRVFAAKRIARVYPALWVGFVFSLLLLFAMGAGTELMGQPRQVLLWVVAQLSVFQFYQPVEVSFGTGVINGSLWTIPVELSFYAVLPLMYYGHQRLRRPYLIWVPLLLVSFASHQALHWRRGIEASVAEKLLSVSLVPYLHYFLVGFLMHRHTRLQVLLWRAPWWIWFTACVVVAGLENVPYLQERWLFASLQAFVSEGLLAAAVFSIALQAPAVGPRLVRGWDLSYGLYIFHMPVINALIQSGIMATWLSLGTAYGLTAMLASLSWRLIERPALRRVRGSSLRKDGSRLLVGPRGGTGRENAKSQEEIVPGRQETVGCQLLEDHDKGCDRAKGGDSIKSIATL